MARILSALAAVLVLVTGSAASGHAAPSAPSARMCSDLASGNLTVENMGDSIASGHGVPDPSKWTSLLAARLNAPVWQAAVGGTTVRDYQEGGAFRFHVEFTKNVKPSLVIMNWRINDQWMSLEHEGYSPAEFKTRYASILSDIRAAAPTTEFLIAVSPSVLDSRIDGRYTQWDYVLKLWELKQEYDTLWVDWMRFMPPLVPNAPGLIAGDGLHPSLLAQPILAAQVYEKITSYCEGLVR